LAGPKTQTDAIFSIIYANTRKYPFLPATPLSCVECVQGD